MVADRETPCTTQVEIQDVSNFSDPVIYFYRLLIFETFKMMNKFATIVNNPITAKRMAQ